MDKKTERILSLCRQPMLAVRDGKLLYCNEAAAECLPEARQGKSLASLLPDYILFPERDEFCAAVEIGGRAFSVFATAADGLRFFTLVPEPVCDRPNFLSDGMAAQLISTLCTLNLGIERAEKNLEHAEKEALGRCLTLLRREYYSLNRQIGNLNTAMLLHKNTAWLDLREIDLVELCADLAGTVSLLTRDRRAKLRFLSQLPELRIMADSVYVERLLLNLLSNSLAHTPPEREIRLEVEQNGKNAVVSVEDDGEGIPPAIMQNIFSRYETETDVRHLDRASTAGLGLTIASGIARLHKGALVIESRMGEGTSVRVMLPLQQQRRATLRGGDTPQAGGMQGILTELCELLPPEYFTVPYTNS